MTSDFSSNYFELFGLPPAYAIDGERLDRAYRDVQSQVHPDRFAAASDAERRRSMQWATLANEAYRTLKQPLARARYLLELNGVDTEEETNTAMPAAFLMQQMDLREAVDRAKQELNAAALSEVVGELAVERKTLLTDLQCLLDGEHDYQAAAKCVRKLRFLDKLQEEIDDTMELFDA